MSNTASTTLDALRVTEVAGALSVAGEIDVATVGTLAAVLERHDPTTSLLLDLSEVSFIDSSGLRTLLVAVQARARAGATVTLLDPSRQVVHLLDVTATANLFRLERARPRR